MAEDLQTVQHIPVGDLHAADDNVRRDVGDVSELAASIQSVGILEPLLVSSNASGYVVVAGARRLAAAKAAGLTGVPAIVREVTDAERIEIGLVENCQRAGLECLEEAEAYRRLIKEFGYTQRVLAKRVGRSQSHIAKRLSLLNLPEDMRAEVDSGGITLPDALELAKLAKTPERLHKALKKGREYGGIEAAVRRQEQELQQEATQAKMVKELKALGVTVLDWPASGYWDTNSPVKPLRNLFWLDADAHAGEPCRAISVAPYGETVELCTDPSRHPRPEGDPYVVELSAERNAAQEAQREREEALSLASQARLAFLQAIVAGRMPKAQLLHQLAWALIENTEWWAAQELACRILGLETTGENDGGEEPDPSLIAAAEAGPDQAGRVALALSLAIAEARVADRWRPEWGRVTRHFAFLEAHGYTVSDVERKELEIAERRRAEYEAAQTDLPQEQGEDADQCGDASAPASSGEEQVEDR